MSNIIFYCAVLDYTFSFFDFISGAVRRKFQVGKYLYLKSHCAEKRSFCAAENIVQCVLQYQHCVQCKGPCESFKTQVPTEPSAFYYTFNRHMVAAIIVRIKTQFTSWVLIHWWWDIATLFSTILLVNCMEIIFFTLQTI